MAQALLLCSLLASLLIATVNAEAVLSLDGMPWTLTNGNGSISLSTTVPAYPLEVLRSNGIIGDPLYRYANHHFVGARCSPFNSQPAAVLTSMIICCAFACGLSATSKLNFGSNACRCAAAGRRCGLAAARFTQ
jgi:hypothetical protein